MKRLIAKLAHLVSSACLCVFATLIPVAVVARFVFHAPIGWVETVCAILLVLFTSATAVVATCEHLHISVQMVSFEPGSLLGRVNSWLVQLIVGATFGLCAYYAFDLAMETNSQSLPEIPDLPASAMYWPIAVAFILMVLAVLEDLVRPGQSIQPADVQIGGID